MKKWFSEKIAKISAFLEKVGEENEKEFGRTGMKCCELNLDHPKKHDEQKSQEEKTKNNNEN